MLRPWKLEIKINFDCETPIYLQIVNAIIDAIKSGKLQRDTALPGSRQLAKLLDVNRNTVVKAIDILTVEGWLVAKERKGVFVADNIPKLKARSGTAQIPNTKNIPKAISEIIFDDGIPDSKMAPMKELSRAYRRVFNQKARWKLMGYANELGTPEFREAIVQMLNFKRGLNIHIDQLCITRGSQMAMYLAAQVLFEKGDIILVENPGYRPAWKAFEKGGARVLHIEVDGEGIIIDKVETALKKHNNIKAVFVTPHHQYPTTVTLSLSRRLRLIELSNTHNFTIIEDDYDHEFHFGQRPVLPISSHREARNYLYIGSMSKVVAPALRIGYLAGNADLIRKIGSLRKIIDVQGDIIMELAVFDLINSGEIRRHLKRTTSHYKEKRDYFRELLETHLTEKAAFETPEGGLAFWVTPHRETDIFELSEKLFQKGIQIITPDKFSNKRDINGMRLGYASLSEKMLEDGVSEIGRLL